VKLGNLLKRLASTIYFLILIALGKKIAIFRFGIGDVLKFIQLGCVKEGVVYFGKDTHILASSFYGLRVYAMPFDAYPVFRVLTKFRSPTHPNDLKMNSLRSYEGKMHFNDYWVHFSEQIKNASSQSRISEYQLVFLDANSTDSLELSCFADFLDDNIFTYYVTKENIVVDKGVVLKPTNKIFHMIAVDKPRIIGVRSGIIDYALIHNCEITCLYANREDYLMYNFGSAPREVRESVFI